MLHGSGRLEWDNGNRYEGELVRGLGTQGRSIALINSRTAVESAPMATITSIGESLKTIASRMDREKDILFLFLTSHGSKDHQFVLGQNGMDLRNLPAKELGALIKETGIRWKVIVVSACYAGGFIDALKDDRTLIITAARHDRRSFGCADGHSDPQMHNPPAIRDHLRRWRVQIPAPATDVSARN